MTNKSLGLVVKLKVCDDICPLRGVKGMVDLLENLTFEEGTLSNFNKNDYKDGSLARA